MNPDRRFRGLVQRRYGLPWSWAVRDLLWDCERAWGEEGSYAMAMRSCVEATRAARTWHLVVREPGETR